MTYNKLTHIQSTIDLQNSQVDDKARDYNPWQEARLTNGDVVFIIRQTTNGYEYHTDGGPVAVTEEEVAEFL